MLHGFGERNNRLIAVRRRNLGLRRDRRRQSKQDGEAGDAGGFHDITHIRRHPDTNTELLRLPKRDAQGTIYGCSDSFFWHVPQ